MARCIEEQFQSIILTIYENLRQSKILYERICKNNNISADKLESQLKISKKFDMNTAIKQGEKEFIRKNKILDSKHRHVFEIMFVLIKNVCINLIQLKSYEKEYDDAYYSMLQVLSMMNYKKTPIENLKKIINSFTKVNYKLVKLLNKAEIEAFGKQEPVEVSFSTRNGKAILVSGSNLKELEDVLKATKGLDLDIYGYQTGLGFLHSLGLTQQVPAVPEIVTNNTSCKRIINIKGREAIIRKPIIPVNRFNYKTLQFIDCLYLLDLEEIKENYKILYKYVRENISKGDLERYLLYYPTSIVNKFLSGGLFSAAR